MARWFEAIVACALSVLIAGLPLYALIGLSMLIDVGELVLRLLEI